MRIHTTCHHIILDFQFSIYLIVSYWRVMASLVLLACLYVCFLFTGLVILHHRLFQFATLHIIERLDAHPPTPLHLLSEDSSQAQGGETQTKTKTETEVLLVTNTQSATESQTDALTGIHSQTQTRTQTKTQTQTQTQSQSIQAPVQEHRVSWLDDTMSSTVLREVNPYPLWPFSLLLFGSSRGTGGGAVSSSSYLADPSNISPQVFEYIQQQHIFFFSKSYLNAMKRSRIACLSLMCWGLCNYFMKVKSISR